MQQEKINNTRDWNLYQVTKRLKKLVSPISNWVEFIVVENEKKYAEIQKFVERPSKPIKFLMGDPTIYPCFKTPQIHKDALLSAVGKVDGYTDPLGIPEVRESLAKKLSNSNWQLNKDDIILTKGGISALFYSIYALCNKGDQFLMQRPSFPLQVSHAMLLGIEPVWYNLESKNGWQPNFKQIEDLLKKNQRIKFIHINNPSNPMGSVLTDDSCKKLIQICKEYNNLPIVADEIYEDMIFSKQKFKFLSEYSETVPVIRCSGLSKKALAPGWRIGWLAFFGRKGIFDQLKQGIQAMSNIIMMPNTICQIALNEVYQNCDILIQYQMEKIIFRRDIFKKNLLSLDGVNIIDATGSMYIVLDVDVDKFINIPNTIVFSNLLQIEENIFVLPGEAFNGKNFLRFLTIADPQQIEETCNRIKNFCNRHKK